ncbi:GAD-like domain-containing protein [Agrococcus sp. Marseille-P2731]|uniref:GAD-like domain-containing protein n=1 Tax=Agrococcus sp. Marseille-P2731 TaxID=1841862 RepID=UPI000930B0A8|nr:GAD-like domain-containing protein [Agrococcus sp. Marseille-P2731]
MIEIPDFVAHAPLAPEVIARYRDRVPAELVEIWEQYGTGTFAEGFIRIIDPQQYEDGVGDCIGRVVDSTESIPVMVTGLGDLITWEPGSGLIALIYREERLRGVGSSMQAFFTPVRAGGAKHLAFLFDWGLFPEAVQAHGAPGFDESFVFVPLLSLGGKKKVANLKPRKTIEAIRMMVEFQGRIEH